VPAAGNTAVMATAPPGVRIEVLDHRPQTMEEVARVATAAFLDDPFFCFLTPNRSLRRRGLQIFWKAMVGAVGERGVVYGARQEDGRLVGAATWVRPGRYPLPVRAQLQQARGAFWAMIPRPPALLAGSRYLLAIDKVHPREPHWYLELLVVDPEAQRGGIGAALQAETYQKADQEGLASYLETQKEDNLAYYRRFGYEVAEELHPVSAGPPLWTMRRPPRTPEA
jgi:GNAT superfamily N-acetyltransferase